MAGRKVIEKMAGRKVIQPFDYRHSTHHSSTPDHDDAISEVVSTYAVVVAAAGDISMKRDDGAHPKHRILGVGSTILLSSIFPFSFSVHIAIASESRLPLVRLMVSR